MHSLRMMLVVAVAWPALAQEQPAKDPDPELTDPSIDRIVREMIDGATTPDTISPRTPARAIPAGQIEGPLLPGMDGYGIDAPPLLPEGAFITRRRARLLRLSGGDWAIVFLESAEAPTMQPMIVLPCRELERVESILEDPSVGGVFDASGQVFVYQGRNYLLPNERHGLLPVQIEQPDDAADEPDASAEVLDPQIAEIVAQLEAEREAHRPLTPLRVEAPDETSGLKEGTFLVRRRGRMIRLSSGQWAFLIDAGATDVGRDPALVVTPSEQLMELERLATTRGEQLVLELTGTTLLYKQRVYIVPLMFQVLFEDNVRPLQ